MDTELKGTSSDVSLRVLTTLFLLFGIYLYLVRPLTSDLLDFTIFWKAAEAFREGSFTYSLRFKARSFDGQSYILPYLYPPTLLALIAPLSLLAMEIARIIWVVLNFIAIGATTYLLLRATKRLPSWAIIGLVACYQPLSQAVMLGQIDAFILLFLTIAIFRERLHLPQLSQPTLIALSAALKVTPGFLVLPHLLKRDWRWLLAMLLPLTLVSLLPLLFPTGTRVTLDFLSEVSAIALGTDLQSYDFNCSLIKLFSFLMPIEISAFLGPIVVLSMGISLCFFIKGETEESRTRLLAALLCLSLLLSPIFWFQHLCWCLPGLFLLGERSFSEPEGQQKGDVQAFGIYCLIGMGSMLLYEVKQTAPELVWAPQLIPTISCLAIILLLILEERRKMPAN